MHQFFLIQSHLLLVPCIDSQEFVLVYFLWIAFLYIFSTKFIEVNHYIHISFLDVSSVFLCKTSQGLFALSATLLNLLVNTLCTLLLNLCQNPSIVLIFFRRTLYSWNFIFRLIITSLRHLLSFQYIHHQGGICTSQVLGLHFLSLFSTQFVFHQPIILLFLSIGTDLLTLHFEVLNLSSTSTARSSQTPSNFTCTMKLSVTK